MCISYPQAANSNANDSHSLRANLIANHSHAGGGGLFVFFICSTHPNLQKSEFS